MERSYLVSFVKDYPSSCQEALLACFDSLNRQGLLPLLEEATKLYEENILVPYEKLAESIERLALLSKENRFTLHLLMLISFTPKLHKEFQKESIPEFYYEQSILDLRYKAEECYLVKGVWGSFVSAWEMLIFQRKILGFGLLQFEICPLGIEAKGMKKEDLVLSIHLPRTGQKLDPNEVEKEIKEARRFYSPLLGDPTFVCSSWLLSSIHRPFLKEDSNILSFMNRFEIVEETTKTDYSEMWRLFDCEIDPKHLEDLPQDTSLRKAYARQMKEGKPIGNAFGILK